MDRGRHDLEPDEALARLSYYLPWIYMAEDDTEPSRGARMADGDPVATSDWLSQVGTRIYLVLESFFPGSQFSLVLQAIWPDVEQHVARAFRTVAEKRAPLFGRARHEQAFQMALDRELGVMHGMVVYLWRTGGKQTRPGGPDFSDVTGSERAHLSDIETAISMLTAYVLRSPELTDDDLARAARSDLVRFRGAAISAKTGCPPTAIVGWAEAYLIDAHVGEARRRAAGSGISEILDAAEHESRGRGVAHEELADERRRLLETLVREVFGGKPLWVPS